MRFSIILIDWYLKNKRDLPWRKNSTPYAVWMSEIMLQQTRVAQGIDYFNKFLKHFPTVDDLANADEELVLKLWQGLGYYSRARNLHFSAKYISDDLQGVFPNNYKDLIQLKGVGDYTASAIASICFNEPVAVVDGNVYRVLARYFGIYTPINSTAGIKEFKSLASSLLDEENPGDYNQAIMEFGALQCKPQQPLCISCPLVGGCEAHKQNAYKVLPIKEKKTKIKKRFLNFIVLETPDGKTLLEKRTTKGIWQNLYQFPLVETEDSIAAAALIENSSFSEIFAENSVQISLYNTTEWTHKLSHQHLYTKFWLVKTSIEHPGLIPISEVDNYPVPRLIEKFLESAAFTENR